MSTGRPCKDRSLMDSATGTGMVVMGGKTKVLEQVGKWEIVLNIAKSLVGRWPEATLSSLPHRPFQHGSFLH